MINDVIRRIEAGYATHRYGGYTVPSLMPDGGSITPREARILYSLVRSVRPTHTLEIGPFFGYSTLWIAQALADCAEQTGRTHVMISYEINKEYARLAHENLIAAGLDEVCDIVLDQRFESLEVDFAFVDGDHTPDGVRSDWEYVGERVARGGLIVFHDAILNVDVRDYLNDEVQPDMVVGDLGLAMKWV